MILFINTADHQKITIGLVKTAKLVAIKSLSAKYSQAEKLLPAIDKLLASNKIKLNDLTGVAAVVGPGSFTALRIGVVTANTLAWSLKIPVAGIKLSDFDNLEELAIKITKDLKTKKSGIVLPFYGKAPNITKKK